MRDMDELLREDARGWRAGAPEPAEFASSLAAAIAAPERGPRQWKLMLAVAATVVVVVAAVALAVGLRHTSTGKTEPASIIVNGKRIPYAGVVPWVAPISYPADRSVVYVYADNDNIHAVHFVCGVQTDRARVVRETPTTVSIEVSGYASALPDDVSCGAPGHAPVPVAVHLERPLGGRMLIDAGNGHAHRVLDAATVPLPRSVPHMCVSRPVTWNESTNVVSAIWSGGSSVQCFVALEYGPQHFISREPPPSGVPGTVPIGGSAAQTWRSHDWSARTITFQWSPRPGFLMRLTVSSAASAPFTPEQELAIARSVR